MRKTLQSTTMAGLIAIAPFVSCLGARAGDLVYEFGEPYLQRIEGVTAGAGNAKDVNALTHIIDPWPPYVANRRIPANGERMTGAVDRYRRGRLQFAPPPIAPTYTTTEVKATGAGATGTGSTEGTAAGTTTTSTASGR
jgi:hypothetical protein